MLGKRRPSEASLRFDDRRRREDTAPRLRDEVPSLVSLRLVIDERRAGAVSPETQHTRLVMIDHAPALFEIPCTYPGCQQGGHDLTDAVLRGLQQQKTEFEGEDACRGDLGRETCGRLLHFVAIAAYRPAARSMLDAQ